jgi:hypothetical protein
VEGVAEKGETLRRVLSRDEDRNVRA